MCPFIFLSQKRFYDKFFYQIKTTKNLFLLLFLDTVLKQASLLFKRNSTNRVGTILRGLSTHRERVFGQAVCHQGAEV